jgi:ADP-ribose pyrophosphatase YjhB (NUDIX family)
VVSEYAYVVLVFDRGEMRFCYRAAAVFIDRGRVLLQEDTLAEPFWVLPGGRMEHGESGWECIRREMREELEEDVRVERLLWFVENFFEHQGKKWHEVGLYFLVSLSEGSRLFGDGPHWGIETEIDLKFRLEWYDVDNLNSVLLLPSFLRERLRALPDQIEYVVHRDE